MTTLYPELLRISSRWWAWVVPMAWQSVFLGAIVLGLATVAHRSSPRFRYLLWLIVLAKLMLPPSLSFYTGVGRILPAPPPSRETSAARGEDEPGGIVSRMMWPQYRPLYSELPADGEAQRTHSGSLPIMIAFCAWVAGMILLTAGLLRQTVRMHLRTRREPA